MTIVSSLVAWAASRGLCCDVSLSGDIAVFSVCHRFRYILTRKVGESPRVLVATGLNPSTADAFKNDPTVRKDVGFAQRWRCGLVIKLNAYGFRATDPDELKRFRRDNDAVGAANDDAIVMACTKPGRSIIVTAWGNHGALDRRALHVCRLLARRRCELFHLGTSQLGNPLHPIARGKSHIPYDRTPTRWDVDWERAIR